VTATEQHERYALSFTSGGLLVREADVIVSQYQRVRDWAAVRQSAIEQNLLQARTTSSSVRVTREVIQRVRLFDGGELELFADASLTERCYLMWTATCRRYDLIGDFAAEVVRERFVLMTPTLGLGDFERFMTAKSFWHPELDELKSSSRAKLRQNLFRMLHEAGLLSRRGDIIPALLSERMLEAFAARGLKDIRFFPSTSRPEVRR
jgi:hypothetical protein